MWRLIPILFALAGPLATARTATFSAHGNEENAVSTPLVSLFMLVDSTSAPHFLAVGVDAARRQSYSNVELVVVDLGETSNSQMIPSSDATWTTYVHHPQHTSSHPDGARSAALAEFVAAARGSILMMWDPRDLHATSRVEEQVRPLIDGSAGLC